MKNFVLGFCGASGSGKSTLLKYLDEQSENIKIVELSARPFLENKEESYDKQMSDIVQSKILLNNTDYTHRYIEQSYILFEKYALSRTPIDVLAYSRVLNHAKIFNYQQIDLIEYLRSIENYFFIYCAADFELEEKNDILRGNNEEIRQKTDIEIRNILEELNIPHFSLRGKLEERKETLKAILEFLNRKKRQYKDSNYKKYKPMNLNELIVPMLNN